jgi:Fic family protein
MESWQPITDLPEDWREMASDDLPGLGRRWQEQREVLKTTRVYQDFLNRLRRRIAIETGVIERLYTIDAGITQLLIERGIDEALIPHGSTDRPALEVVALIQDHDAAMEGLFKFVAGQRRLTLSYVRELHQVLTRHQDTASGKDADGIPVSIRLIRGDWKKWPNNPTRPDGSIHAYCPPEQVQPQMEQLIRWHESHGERLIAPEVEAAWLHHRFTQIHPFQDGNGRVARCLASLIFIRAGWFPLVITRQDRGHYIDALEAADQGELRPLVQLFAQAQRDAFGEAFDLSSKAQGELSGRA